MAFNKEGLAPVGGDLVCQDIPSLETNDYLENFIANISDTSNLTVEDINVIIERLN